MTKRDKQSMKWQLECVQCGKRHIPWPKEDDEFIRCPECGNKGQVQPDRSPRDRRVIKVHGFERHEIRDRTYSDDEDRGRGVSKGEFDNLDELLNPLP